VGCLLLTIWINPEQDEIKSIHPASSTFLYTNLISKYFFRVT
jgi:hypothetical protein